jgi:5-hydroxyisourate hydrolase
MADRSRGMTRLTTHVLDTANGCPAAGVRVRLFHQGALLGEGATNADGRCPGLTGDGALQRGAYRLEFAVGGYFRGRGTALPDPPFLDVIAIDFSVADPSAHYHVPLLVSPFGYSTYRGS